MALAALGTPTLVGAARADPGRRRTASTRSTPFDPVALFGPARERGAPMSSATSTSPRRCRRRSSDTVLTLAGWLREASGETPARDGRRRRAQLRDERASCATRGIFDEVWVQPAAGDAGTALGAALWIDRQRAQPPARARRRRAPGRCSTPTGARASTTTRSRRCCAGPRSATAGWTTSRAPRRRASSRRTRSSAGSRAAWSSARGRSARARSSRRRSIPTMQARLNELKDREDFRPVAPVVPREDLADWFTPADANGGEAPFMLFVYDVEARAGAAHPGGLPRRPTARACRPSSARPTRATTTRSRRSRRAPACPSSSTPRSTCAASRSSCTPKDALDAFFSTPLDALVIGCFLVEKTDEHAARGTMASSAHAACAVEPASPRVGVGRCRPTGGRRCWRAASTRWSRRRSGRRLRDRGRRRRPHRRHARRCATASRAARRAAAPRSATCARDGDARPRRRAQPRLARGARQRSSPSPTTTRCPIPTGCAQGEAALSRAVAASPAWGRVHVPPPSEVAAVTDNARNTPAWRRPVSSPPTRSCGARRWSRWADSTSATGAPGARTPTCSSRCSPPMAEGRGRRRAAKRSCCIRCASASFGREHRPAGEHGLRRAAVQEIPAAV